MANMVHFCRGHVKTITTNIMHLYVWQIHLDILDVLLFFASKDCLQNKESHHSVQTENRTLC